MSLPEVVAIVVGLSNLACMILGGVVVWWRVAVSDKLILASLQDVQERLRRIEDRSFPRA
jgi:hypothetical protein